MLLKAINAESDGTQTITVEGHFEDRNFKVSNIN